MKKKMVEQINTLIAKNNELYNDNVVLSKQLDVNKSQIEELKNVIESLKGEVNRLTEELQNEALVAKIDSTSENVTDEPVEPVVEEVSDKEQPLNIYSAQQQPISLHSASSIIGRIVLECAEACNEFTEVGGQNAKDLVNLALGRTEVFKSEILNIMTENEDFNSAKTEVDLKVAEIREYFDLLRKQL